MIRELNHVGMRTSDLSAALRFFKDGLSGCVIRDIEVPVGRMVFVQIGNSVIELIQNPPGQGDFGFTHTAFRTAANSSIELCHRNLEQAGCCFTVPPKIAASGNGKLAFFRDPFGALHELIERETDARIECVEDEPAITIDSVMLSISHSHVGAASRFFVDYLDFDHIRDSLENDQFTQVFAHSGGKDRLTLVHDRMAAAPVLSLRFLVDSCDRLLKRLAMTSTPDSVHRQVTHDGKTVLFFTGPDNTFMHAIERFKHA